MKDLSKPFSERDKENKALFRERRRIKKRELRIKKYGYDPIESGIILFILSICCSFAFLVYRYIG